MRKKKSESRLSLHYDKLYVDNTVYVYNEESEEVEMIDHTIIVMRKKMIR